MKVFCLAASGGGQRGDLDVLPGAGRELATCRWPAGSPVLRLGAPTDLRLNHGDARGGPAQRSWRRWWPIASRACALAGNAAAAATAEAGAGRAGMVQLAWSESDRLALKKLAGEIAGGAQLGAQGTAEFARRATAWLAQRHGYALQRCSCRRATGDPLVRWLDSRELGRIASCSAERAGDARACRGAIRRAWWRVSKGGGWNAFEEFT